MNGPFIQLFEVVRCVQRFAGRESEPRQIVDDRTGELDVFGVGIRVVESQIAHTAEVRGDPVVDADGLGVTDVQVAVRFGWKAGLHATTEVAGLDVGLDQVADEIESAARRIAGRAVGDAHGQPFSPVHLWKPRTRPAGHRYGVGAVTPNAAPPETTDPVSEPLVVKPLLRGWSHVVAFVVVAVLGVIMASVADSPGERVLVVIYLAGTLTMFGISSMYHRLAWNDRGRSVMRRLDHSAIFLAIAGAYTPVVVVALDGSQRVAVLVAVWGGSIVGITLEWLPVKVPRAVFTAVYVIVGWSAVIALPELYDALGAVGFALVLGGGLLYTIGAVVYALKRPDPWPLTFGYHEIFHLFPVGGAACHLAAIAFYVVPLM